MVLSMGKRKLKRKVKYLGFDKSFIISCVLIVLLFIGIIIFNNVLTPQINLKGKHTVIINYKDKDYPNIISISRFFLLVASEIIKMSINHHM